MKITEGVHGYYFYHLSEEGVTARGLCGANTMKTSIPLIGWGIKTHLGERYCAECEIICKTKEG